MLTCPVFLNIPPGSGAADRTPVSLDPGFGFGGVQDRIGTPCDDQQDTGKHCEAKSGLAGRHRWAGWVPGLHSMTSSVKQTEFYQLNAVARSARVPVVGISSLQRLCAASADSRAPCCTRPGKQ